MATVETLGREVGVKPACEALRLPRATFYRGARRDTPLLVTPRSRPPLALTPEERATALEDLNTERFVDQAPPAIYATLLDEGIYHCSVRTLYRILAQEDAVRERRNVRRHPDYHKPESSLPAPISSGRGTSPSSRGRRPGPTSTST